MRDSNEARTPSTPTGGTAPALSPEEIAEELGRGDQPHEGRWLAVVGVSP